MSIYSKIQKVHLKFIVMIFIKDFTIITFIIYSNEVIFFNLNFPFSPPKINSPSYIYFHCLCNQPCTEAYIHLVLKWNTDFLNSNGRWWNRSIFIGHWVAYICLYSVKMERFKVRRKIVTSGNNGIAIFWPDRWVSQAGTWFYESSKGQVNFLSKLLVYKLVPD